MLPEETVRHSLRIEVPTATGGFMLVQRLRHGFELEGTDETGWLVSGSADGDLPNVLATIQQRLHEEGTDEVTVHVGDHTHRMTRD
jgi:hypothetical protein